MLFDDERMFIVLQCKSIAQEGGRVGRRVSVRKNDVHEADLHGAARSRQCVGCLCSLLASAHFLATSVAIVQGEVRHKKTFCASSFPKVRLSFFLRGST